MTETNITNNPKCCFISHCHEDKKMANDLAEIIGKYYEGWKIFNSSNEESGVEAGEGLSPTLRTEIQNATVMICLMTEMFLRSFICLAEYSAGWYRGDLKPVPIAFTQEAKELVDTGAPERNVFADAEEKPNSAASLLVRAFDKHEDIGQKKRELFRKELLNWIKKNSGKRTYDTDRAYIGSREVFQNINKYCEKFQVTRISDGNHDADTVGKMLSGMKDIYIYATTGSTLVDNLGKTIFPNLLAKGANIHMIIPEKNSEFIRDTAIVERGGGDYERNLNRIKGEFDHVVDLLKSCLESARAKTGGGKTGSIYLYNAFTNLRQTILMGVPEDGDCWGWVTVTMPPSLSAGNSPTITFEGPAEEGDVDNAGTFSMLVYNHVRQAINVAKSRKRFVELSLDGDVSDFESNDDPPQYWSKRMLDVKKNMKRAEKREGALIEIAAQHPLCDNGKPDLEFSDRLDLGIKVYKRLRSEGEDVKILVPGSIHMDSKGKADPVSLSESGKNYLISKGIPEEDIYGEDAIHEIMDGAGCYNSGDECKVAAQLFMTREFKELHSVCSPEQMIRKQLLYVVNGVWPQFHTTLPGNPSHDFAEELCSKIPNIITQDEMRDWSDPNCPIFRKSREERCPGYAESLEG